MQDAIAPKGHIYVIQAEDGPVKIGLSIRPLQRIAQVSAASGHDFTKVYISQAVRDPRHIEQQLHAHFAEFRRAGEWFNIPFDTATSAAECLVTPAALMEGASSQTYVRGRDLRRRALAMMDAPGYNTEQLRGFMAGLSDDDFDAIDQSMRAEAVALLDWAGEVAEILTAHGLPGVEIMAKTLEAKFSRTESRSQTDSQCVAFDGEFGITSGAGVTIE